METIKILDVINTPNAILHSFGIKVFDVISGYLSKDQQIILSFEGLKNVNSAFCNASIGKAYLTYHNTNNLLKLQGYELNQIWKDKVEDAIFLANNPEKIEIHNRAISDLFCE